mmetsp:Transcript_93232/g.240953  ORF Transcript_93232/g.240953 Transcript_93232/m.240953 type:complete len:215 (+) Transcript_93232:80-724(+)
MDVCKLPIGAVLPAAILARPLLPQLGLRRLEADALRSRGLADGRPRRLASQRLLPEEPHVPAIAELHDRHEPGPGEPRDVQLAAVRVEDHPEGAVAEGQVAGGALLDAALHAQVPHVQVPAEHPAGGGGREERADERELRRGVLLPRHHGHVVEHRRGGDDRVQEVPAAAVDHAAPVQVRGQDRGRHQGDADAGRLVQRKRHRDDEQQPPRAVQ